MTERNRPDLSQKPRGVVAMLPVCVDTGSLGWPDGTTAELRDAATALDRTAVLACHNGAASSWKPCRYAAVAKRGTGWTPCASACARAGTVGSGRTPGQTWRWMCDRRGQC